MTPVLTWLGPAGFLIEAGGAADVAAETDAPLHVLTLSRERPWAVALPS